MWDAADIAGLGDCPPAGLIWAARGYRVGLRDGRDQLLAELGEAGHAAARGARKIMKQPTHAELVERRAFNPKPCPARCGRCSSCVCAEARASRGGRDYLGAEREAELARRGAA